MITVYLVYEALENGSITLSTPVDISDYPYKLTTNSEASNVPMEARNYTVEQLLEATLVSSANSAAIALAEKIAGSEKDFVDMMRAKLLEWGIQDATVVNTTGLNNETLGDNIYPGSKKDDENKLSAYDVAIVARNLIKKYPQVLEITKKPSSTFAGMTITSTNYMLEGMPAYRGGFDGLKTGTTDKAGESFVGTTVEKGMRVITVVLNADHQDNNPYARFTATSSLMDYISSTFHASVKSFKKAMPTKIVKLLYKMEKKMRSLPLPKMISLLLNVLGDNRPKQFNSHLILRQYQHHLKPELWLDI